MTVHYQHTPRTFDKGSDKGTPLIKQIRALLFGRASSLAQPLKEHHYHSRTFVRDVWSDSGVVSIIWILLWAFVLWWGERAVFDSKVGNCAWNRWEQWVLILFLRLSQLLRKRRADTITATDSKPPSCGFAGGSSIGRPTYISWSSVASFNIDRPLYRPLLTKILRTASADTGPGYLALFGRFV